MSKGKEMLCRAVVWFGVQVRKKKWKCLSDVRPKGPPIRMQKNAQEICLFTPKGLKGKPFTQFKKRKRIQGVPL